MSVAVVTGGTGCLGFHVVQELLRNNWKVIVLHRKTSNLSMFDGRVTLVEVNLHDLNSVVAAIPAGVSALFHIAGNVAHHTDENQWMDNVLATRNLTKAALQKGVGRFIFTSTAAARYARHTSDPATLRKEIPCSYAYTKRLAELEVWNAGDAGLDALILQPIIVLGEWDFHCNYSQLFQPNILTKLRAALPGHLEFCDARMVARAHVEAYHHGRRDRYYVLGGAHMSWFELQQVIARVVGAKPPLFTLPKWSLYVIAFMHALGYRLFNVPPQMTTDLIWLLGSEDPLLRPEIRAAEEDLGYRRGDVNIREICERMYEWIKTQK